MNDRYSIAFDRLKNLEHKRAEASGALEEARRLADYQDAPWALPHAG